MYRFVLVVNGSLLTAVHHRTTAIPMIFAEAMQREGLHISEAMAEASENASRNREPSKFE